MRVEFPYNWSFLHDMEPVSHDAGNVKLASGVGGYPSTSPVNDNNLDPILMMC